MTPILGLIVMALIMISPKKAKAVPIPKRILLKNPLYFCIYLCYMVKTSSLKALGSIRGYLNSLALHKIAWLSLFRNASIITSIFFSKGNLL